MAARRWADRCLRACPSPRCARYARSVERGGRPPVRASRSRASRGTRRRPWRRPAGCAGRRRGRRGFAGTRRVATPPSPRGRGPRRRHLVRGARWSAGFRPCVLARRRPGVAAGGSRRGGPASAPRAAAAAAPRAGRARASGFGGPPVRRCSTSDSPSGGSSIVAPQARHIAPSPFRATGPPVGIVERTERLVRGREVAFRVARAAPEQATGATRAARDEMALVAPRARDLERERLRRRRPLLLDVVAVGIARAADERPEPATLLREGPAVAPRRTWGTARRRPTAARRPCRGLRSPSPRGLPGRRAAAASPCAPGRASTPGTRRSGRGGSPSGGPRSRPRRWAAS